MKTIGKSLLILLFPCSASETALENVFGTRKFPMARNSKIVPPVAQGVADRKLLRNLCSFCSFRVLRVKLRKKMYSSQISARCATGGACLG